MATLYIHRATPFKRGAQSIQILVDGKSACTLWNNDPKIVEVKEGEHTLQAIMGGAIGEPITLQVQSSETRKVELLPGELKLENSVLIVASTLLWIMPDPLHWELFFLVKLAIAVAVACYIRYDIRKHMKGKLLLTDEGTISPEELPQQLRGKMSNALI